MDNVKQNIQDMYGRKPIEYDSEDYEKGYNSGYTDAMAELAERLEIPLNAEDSRTLTKESLALFRRLEDAVRNRVGEVLHSKTKLETGKGYEGSIQTIEFDGEVVEVETIVVSNCSCCRDEHRSYYFPINYLYRDSYLDAVKVEIERREKEAAQKKQEEEEKRKREHEERERKELERLQQKYGEDKK